MKLILFLLILSLPDAVRGCDLFNALSEMLYMQGLDWRRILHIEVKGAPRTVSCLRPILSKDIAVDDRGNLS